MGMSVEVMLSSLARRGCGCGCGVGDSRLEWGPAGPAREGVGVMSVILVGRKMTMVMVKLRVKLKDSW